MHRWILPKMLALDTNFMHLMHSCTHVLVICSNKIAKITVACICIIELLYGQYNLQMPKLWSE